MIKNFHENSISLDDYLKDGTKYIDCYIRNKTILFDPEEEVRQAFLKFIYESSGLDMTSFIAKIEFQNLDIAFYYKYGNKNFQPIQHPILIIETKKDGTNLLNCKDQIVKYLKLNFCQKGLLITSKTIYFLNSATGYNPQRIGINYIKQLFNEIELNIKNDIEYFNSAEKGVFDDFMYLAKKYNTSNIIFLCTDFSAPITAFLFCFDDKYILYDVCGATSKKKKHKIKISSFLRLVSIKN